MPVRFVVSKPKLEVDVAGDDFPLKVLRANLIQYSLKSSFSAHIKT